MTGLAASGPRLPSPRMARAVGDHGDEVRPAPCSRTRPRVSARFPPRRAPPRACRQGTRSRCVSTFLVGTTSILPGPAGRVVLEDILQGNFAILLDALFPDPCTRLPPSVRTPRAGTCSSACDGRGGEDPGRCRAEKEAHLVLAPVQLVEEEAHLAVVDLRRVAELAVVTLSLRCRCCHRCRSRCPG